MTKVGYAAQQTSEPLRDYETVVRLIAAKGSKVACRPDHRKYPVGRKLYDPSKHLLVVNVIYLRWLIKLRSIVDRLAECVVHPVERVEHQRRRHTRS